MEKNKYITAHYSVSVELAKPPATIFGHLIHDVSKFWPEDFEGESSKLNDEFIFRTGDAHFSKNRIAEFVPDKKVVWLVTESIRKTDGFDWAGARMSFELTPKGSGTLLTYTYDGPVFEHEYDRLTQICDMVIKESLYNFITTGKEK